MGRKRFLERLFPFLRPITRFPNGAYVVYRVPSPVQVPSPFARKRSVTVRGPKTRMGVLSNLSIFQRDVGHSSDPTYPSQRLPLK